MFTEKAITGCGGWSDQMARKPIGWRKEPARHALASRGIRTTPLKQPIWGSRDTPPPHLNLPEIVNARKKMLPYAERRRIISLLRETARAYDRMAEHVASENGTKFYHSLSERATHMTTFLGDDLNRDLSDANRRELQEVIAYAENVFMWMAHDTKQRALADVYVDRAIESERTERMLYEMWGMW